MTMASAEVITVDGRLVVRLEGAEHEARRAKSCLVAPELGDRVLCAIEGQDVFVLAVLSGDPTSETRITAPTELVIDAPRVSLRAEEANVAVGRLGFFGEWVSAHAKKFQVLAEELDSTAEVVMQRAKRVFRMVEDVDQTRAGTIDVRAEGLAAIRSENTIISARVLAKIDGEQINLG